MKKNKDKKEPDIKNKHGKLSNLWWAIKNMWRMDKFYLLFAIPGIPIAIITGIAASYFPKLLIDMLGSGEGFAKIAVTAVVFLGGMLLLTLIDNFASAKCWGKRYTVSNRYQGLSAIKDSTIDYEMTEQQEYKKSQGYAQRDLTQGNTAVEYFWSDLQSFLIRLFGIITLASLMAALNPLIFAVVAVVSVMSYFLTRWQSKYTEKHKEKWEKESRKASYIENLSEDLPRSKDIKLYGMQGWVSDMLHGFLAHVRMWQSHCDKRGLWANIISAALTLLQDGCAYFFLIGMLFAGKLGVGDFIFYFGIVGSIASYLSGIMSGTATIVNRCEKIGYVRDYLELEGRFNHGKGCALPRGNELPVKIEFRDVWYKYEGAEDYTLKGINLTINQGEKLALVGVNGAGKTTLVKLLCGFYMPTKGEITVAGKSIAEYNIDEYYTLISAVFQDINIPAMTICEFVGITDFGGTIDREKAEKAIRLAGLGEKVDSLENGIDTYLKKGIYPGAIDLSGGESQKLMLARAIYKGGEMLILDEPTAALDPIAENNLYMKYSELTHGKTSVYISHRLASTRFCDKVALLEGGVIAELGTHDELMEKGGKYAYMFGVQSKYYKEEQIDA